VSLFPKNAPVDLPALATGIGLLMPPSEPDAKAMDNSDGEKNCPSNQEAPELFVKASVEVLAPARQAKQIQQEEPIAARAPAPP
jgi:hypothetical protein